MESYGAVSHQYGGYETGTLLWVYGSYVDTIEHHSLVTFSVVQYTVMTRLASHDRG